MPSVKIRIIGNNNGENGFVTCPVNARTLSVKEHLLPRMGILKYEDGDIVLSETLSAGTYEYHILAPKDDTTTRQQMKRFALYAVLLFLLICVANILTRSMFTTPSTANTGHSNSNSPLVACSGNSSDLKLVQMIQEITKELERSRSAQPQSYSSGDTIKNGSTETVIMQQHEQVVTPAEIRKFVEYCNRPWPELALVIPLSMKAVKDPRYYEFESMFLRSFMFFWPLKLSNTSLMLMYDQEKEHLQYLKTVKTTMKEIESKITGGVKILPVQPFPQYYELGYDRQQYNMFYADNFTTAEYVGFCDSDTAFNTYVDREDLFEYNNAGILVPVVNAHGGYEANITAPHINGWNHGTYRALGILQPFKCMSYFPVIVKTAHLKEMRDFIAKHHNKSFDRAFRENINNPALGTYSQFNIFCGYLWHFHRNDYKWYIHDQTPNWDGANPPPVPGQDGTVGASLTAEMRLPKPLIAVHARYRYSSPESPTQPLANRIEYNLFMQGGVCYSPPFPRTESVCVSVDPTKFHYEMHSFEYINHAKLSTLELLNEEAKKRHERLKYCDHSWNPDELNLVRKTRHRMTAY